MKPFKIMRMRSVAGGGAPPPPSITFTNKANTTPTLQGDDSYTIVKTSADNWDGAAYTAASFTADFTMVLRTYANDKNLAFGASNSPSGTADNTDFDAYLGFNGAGTVLSGTGGGLTGSSNAYSANQFWFLRRVSGLYEVRYGVTGDWASATSLSDFGFGASPDNATYGAKLALYYNTSQANVRAYA